MHGKGREGKGHGTDLHCLARPRLASPSHVPRLLAHSFQPRPVRAGPRPALPAVVTARDLCHQRRAPAAAPAEGVRGVGVVAPPGQLERERASPALQLADPADLAERAAVRSPEGWRRGPWPPGPAARRRRVDGRVGGVGFRSPRRGSGRQRACAGANGNVVWPPTPPARAAVDAIGGSGGEQAAGRAPRVPGALLGVQYLQKGRSVREVGCVRRGRQHPSLPRDLLQQKQARSRRRSAVPGSPAVANDDNIGGICGEV
jgi:hypothetical protein